MREPGDKFPVAIIGVGNMGGGMARNLLAKGWQVNVCWKARLAKRISPLRASATCTAVSRPSMTVTKRSCARWSSTRTRFGSVMSFIDAIQPICLPSESISGEK